MLAGVSVHVYSSKRGAGANDSGGRMLLLYGIRHGMSCKLCCLFTAIATMGREGARRPCATRSSRLMQGIVPAAAVATDLQ